MSEAQETDWGRLMQLATLNQLALGQLALRIIEDPTLGTDAMRDQLLEMIENLEYELAKSEEFLI